VNGLEFLFITILVTILKKEWDMTQFQLELLISIYFIGAFFGSIYAGIIADQLGR
jgi:MFS family permease